MRRVLGSFVVVAAGSLVAFGCSSTSTDTTAVAAGPPAVALSAFGCADPARMARLVVDGRIYAPVEATLTNVTLKPPGGCYGLPQCGQLVVTATVGGNEITSFLATTPHVDVPLPASTATNTDVTVTVAARNDDGSPMLDAAGKQATSAITARLTEPNASECVTSPK
jgi:hypothetical protein